MQLEEFIKEAKLRQDFKDENLEKFQKYQKKTFDNETHPSYKNWWWVVRCFNSNKRKK